MRIGPAHLLLPALALGAWACSDGTVELPGTARLEVHPSALEFGDVLIGTTATLAVTLDNVGSLELQLEVEPGTNVTACGSGGASTFCVTPVGPLTLAPGQRATLSAELRPVEDQRVVQGALRITGCPGCEAAVTLSGRGFRPAAPPDLRVTPSALDFGLAAAGVEVPRELLLENLGEQPLIVEGAAGIVGAPVRASGVGRIEPGQAMMMAVVATMPEGAWQGVLRIASNDPDGPLDVPVQGEGEPLPRCEYAVTEQVTLGAGEAGRPEVGWVRLQNRGLVDCLITQVAFSAGSAPELLLPRRPALPLRVPAWTWWDLPVEMIVTAPGPVQGVLQLTIDGASEPQIRIPIEGLGAETGFFASPPALDFGALPATCSAATRTVRLWRHSEAPTTLTGLRVEGDGFSLDRGPDLSSGPATVPTGESAEVVIGLAARPTTTSAGVLVIDSTVNDQAVTQRVPLIGRGLDAARVVERFVQLDRAMVDVLLAIDFTGCMTEERVGLANNFDALMRIVNVGQLNYQVGVTTTDLLLEAGRLMYPNHLYGDPFGGRPEDRIITASSVPDPEALYALALQARDEGGGIAANESGMGALYLALQPELLVGHNAGILRRDAHLGVLILTDEPDQTSRAAGSPSDSLDFYLDYYRAMKGVDGKTAFTAVAIAGDPPNGCEEQGGRALAAPRLAELADRSGGAFESVCSADWVATNEALSGAVAGEHRAFFLTQAPDPATLEVSVDGAPLPTTSWAYRASDRSIRFEPSQIPEPGAEIVIGYLPACP